MAIPVVTHLVGGQNVSPLSNFQIGLTTEDKTRDLDAVKSFVKEFKISYPIGWANREIAMDVMAGRGAIPQTLVIGKDGKVTKHLVGFNMQVSAPQLRMAIEEAVAE